MCQRGAWEHLLNCIGVALKIAHKGSQEVVFCLEGWKLVLLWTKYGENFVSMGELVPVVYGGVFHTFCFIGFMVSQRVVIYLVELGLWGLSLFGSSAF